MTRYRLPAEYARDATWRGLALRWVPWLGFCVVPAGVYLWRGFTYHEWGGTLLAAAFGGVFGACAWESVESGYTVTKFGGLVYRREQPGLFWTLVVLYFAIYLVTVAALIFAKP